ncbi:hypothetical protein HPP92_020363 [Vanilla planifolia]|uniref:C2 domain-containing protein n=1 Tax=Vanilla planifolia TaxID=51239 RepID=A0A835UHJ0_VANPL|nr:hypothetical protein HPP92_020363 [Vanilla planifolia]
MATRYDVEVTILSARDLKNVNWRHGNLRPYAVAWIDQSAKCSTKVDIDHDTDPEWDEKLTIPLPPGRSLRDATLFIDIVHADAEENTKPLVGSTRLPLSEVVDEVGIGGKLERTIKLKRPSGRPQGKLDLRIVVKEPLMPYYDPYAPPQTLPVHGQPYGSRDFRDPYAYASPRGYPYGAPPPAAYPYAGPPAVGYQYGGAQPAYDQTASGSRKSSKFGMGTGLAVGAAAGVLGGLALAEGVDYVEDKFEDDVSEKVDEDLADDYYGGGDDF